MDRNPSPKPWRKSLAVRVLEQAYGHPIEVTITAMWRRYRYLPIMASMIGIAHSTLQTWMNSANLYVCFRCSIVEGILHSQVFTCPGCHKRFCPSCLDIEAAINPEHFAVFWPDLPPNRTGA